MSHSPHPLAQLSKEEFLKARDIIVRSHGSQESLYFRATNLNEPSKHQLVPFLEAEHAGTLTAETARPPRLAFVQYDVITSASNEYTRAVVDLGTGQVVSRNTALKNAYPHWTIDEWSQCVDICFNSSLFKDAISAFSLPDGFSVTLDPWPYGGSDSDEDKRYAQGLVFARNSAKHPDSNPYAYPIPIIPVIDWSTKRVVRVDRLATGGVGDPLTAPDPTGLPRILYPDPKPAEYIPELLDRPLRTDLKPLNIVQPEGTSFSIHPDGLVQWQKWRFRLGFTPREGAVLHDVCYENRPILYRLSYSELTVPYADPRPPFQRKQAFDFGDGGVGRAANNLMLGCDCLGAIHYFDSLLVAPDGAPSEAKAVVCLHEQDNGVLWKHTDFRSNRAVVTRSRELVVQFICTLANYEYVFAYKLDLAGGITLETRATGIVSVVYIDEGKKSEYGNIVAPNLLAQNHQHIFAARIDPAIDSYRLGDTNVVVEESRHAKMDAATNPHGNRYEVWRSTVDTASWIDAEPRLNRLLRLENAHIKNSISGKNVGYKLMVPATQMILADEKSVLARRAPFAKHNFWVTGYRDGELWAAGLFTNQSRAEAGGVEAMVARGDWFTDAAEPSPELESSRGEGINEGEGRRSSPIIWAVYGLTHNPRVEDWPVMPVEIYQIHLRPADFFTSNPALDVPSTRNEASVLVPCCGAHGVEKDAKSMESGSVQKDAVGHKQGTGQEIDARDVGAASPENKAERRLSRMWTGLFKPSKSRTT